ncbi:uncharacterized protein LOC128556726 [Mercenaria mercenaria]|uniref:uncharacterized protein LOC128556726 n=1 Tax=Mercenaria mercenaria TaxID=6596 RepID=UPI00234E5B81|nr:uncharacterized protein LOC128556726 [Mercenaria mercenaria]XP_053398357.1 uncharacterized protein LOC128556726 [Mercenaria mercenaria]
MGNDSSKTGPSQPPEVLNALRKNTPFTSLEADQIIRRYSAMDSSSQGKDGITTEQCIMMPEFTGCVFAPDVIQYYRDSTTKKIHPKQFMKICTMLCRRTPALKKKEFLFDLYDVDKQKVLTHDAMFRMYRLLFHSAISDDHILALVSSALRHPNLSKDGEVTRDEFTDMIPDVEIQERLSVDFAFDPSFQPDEPEEEDDEDEDEADDNE